MGLTFFSWMGLYSRLIVREKSEEKVKGIERDRAEENIDGKME